MKYLTVLLLALSMPVQADWVLRQGDDIIRLTEAPCINEVALTDIPEHLRPMFKQATAIINGKTFAPCWVPYRGTAVYLSYEDGESGMLDARTLKVEPGI